MSDVQKRLENENLSPDNRLTHILTRIMSLFIHWNTCITVGTKKIKKK